MAELLTQNLDKMYHDIVKDYVHDNNVDDDINDILKMITDLKTKIEWTL